MGYKRRLKANTVCIITGEADGLTVHHAYPKADYPQWIKAPWNCLVCIRPVHDLIEASPAALRACQNIARRQRRAMEGKGPPVSPEHIREAILAAAPEIRAYLNDRRETA